MQLYSFPAGCSPNFQKRVSVGLGCGFVALPLLSVFKIKKKSKAFLKAMLLFLRLVSVKIAAVHVTNQGGKGLQIICELYN
jgi:hypothetical protein